jgi:DNA-binding transcriptional LysR family regulator
MNFDQLEAVLTIIDKGSFKIAAEHLNRSQPTLSANVKNLEEEFGIQIFDRNTYRPTLTEVGAVFIDSARKTLEAAYHTTKVAKELGQNKAETKIHIAIDPLVPIEAIELIAHECARPIIPVTLILDKTILHRSYETLLNGKIDLALAMCPENDEGIDKIVIETVTLVAVVSKKLLQEIYQPNEHFLMKHAQILVHHTELDEGQDNLFPKPLLEGPGPKIYVPDHYTKLHLITHGLGWGRISAEEAEKINDLVIIDDRVCKKIELDLCLMKSKHHSIGPIAKVIWDVFEKKSFNI